MAHTYKETVPITHTDGKAAKLSTIAIHLGYLPSHKPNRRNRESLPSQRSSLRVSTVPLPTSIWASRGEIWASRVPTLARRLRQESKSPINKGYAQGALHGRT